MSNIITAVFQTTNATKTRPLYKYNYGQILMFSGIELPETYEVHLCNVGDSETKTAIGTADGVEIYDEYLRTGRDINAYIMLHAEMDSGETEYKVTIPVKYRPVPGDSLPTPEQQDIVSQALAALNNGIDQANESAEEAEAWAVGTRSGVPVDEDDETYENSAKYWARKAMTDAPVTSVNGEAGDVELDLDDIPDGETYARATPAQLAQIATNAADIADVRAVSDTALQPDDLNPYRTAAAQDSIDAGKQSKITASGILKGNGSGGVSAATAGTDYATPQQVNAKYTKPANGIPATDMTSAVRASLSKADTALQAVPDTYRTAADQDEIDDAQDANISNNADDIDAINAKIPAQASANNQLADKSFVNSSIQTSSAHFRGNWQNWAAVPTNPNLYPVDDDGNHTPTSNDYMVIQDASDYPVQAGETALEGTWRFKYSGVWATNGRNGWQKEYQVNAAPLTSAQLAALNSGATAELIAQISTNEEDISAINAKIPANASDANKLTDESRVNTIVNAKLTYYRTATAQKSIDDAQDLVIASKQPTITASGILKGDGNGGVSAAIEGTDYIERLEILSYGNSTWDDFLSAYTANKVVYCRASSNTNPASGDQTRLAFMAYVNNADNPTNVEFQYYRSIQTHSDSQQGDQVFVYKLDKTAGWTVTTRNTFTAIDAGTGLSKAYSNGKLTLSVDGYRTAADQDLIDDAQDERIEGLEQTTTATTIGPVALATFNASAANMPLKGLTANIEPVQAEGTPSPENPLPISGWTGANVTRCGKNFLPITLESCKELNTSGTWSGNTYTFNNGTFTVLTDDSGAVTGIVMNGTFNNNTTFGLVVGIKLPVGNYILNGCPSGGSANTYRLRLTSSGTNFNDYGSGLSIAVNDKNRSYLAQMYCKYGVVYDNVLFTPMLRLSTDSSTYEPYKGNTYDITFPTEAGTVYGGKVSYGNGKWTLAVDHYVLTVTGDAITGRSILGNNLRTNLVYVDSEAKATGRNALAIANWLPRVVANYSADVMGFYFDTDARIYIKAPISVVGNTIESVKTYFDENPLVVVYPLATPIVYDLSDIPEITTLLGTNNIWVNRGDVTVTYGAYLETVKAHADQLGESILGTIAPLETGYTASRSYAAGSFLFVGTKFYKVTAAIASGDTINPGTNVTQTTVAEQLIALAAN